MNFVAAVLIGVGAFFSVCNWLCLLSSLRRRRFVSPVFPAPSLLTTLGLALADSTRPYWWVGLLTDYTFFSLLAARSYTAPDFRGLAPEFVHPTTASGRR